VFGIARGLALFQLGATAFESGSFLGELGRCLGQFGLFGGQLGSRLGPFRPGPLLRLAEDRLFLEGLLRLLRRSSVWGGEHLKLDRPQGQAVPRCKRCIGKCAPIQAAVGRATAGDGPRRATQNQTVPRLHSFHLQPHGALWR
jgi:hypothetical protein